MIKTMEAISTCSSEYGEWSWDTETLTKARGLIHQLVSFEFLVTFNVTTSLERSRSLTIKLQKKSSDILAAYEHVSEVITDLELLKTNCQEEFHLWYCEIKTLAEELNILIATPRITAMHIHRSNILANRVSDQILDTRMDRTPA